MEYGPDGVGGCILDADATDGLGRFPDLHGSFADEGYYGSTFIESMWEAYGALPPAPPPVPPPSQPWPTSAASPAKCHFIKAQFQNGGCCHPTEEHDHPVNQSECDELGTQWSQECNTSNCSV